MTNARISPDVRPSGMKRTGLLESAPELRSPPDYPGSIHQFEHDGKRFSTRMNGSTHTSGAQTDFAYPHRLTISEGNTMPRVNHFEIHASNPGQLIDFYTKLFGWKFEPWGPPNSYWMIRTGGDGEEGIDGGLLPRRGGVPSSGQPVNASVCTVRVASARDTYQAALSLGASEALPVAAIPGMGWLGYVKDPDGNIFGVMSPDANAI
jgi:uncharacterized protein